MRNKIKTTNYWLPVYWASALINDDYSGLEFPDEIELNNWMEKEKPGSCVSVGEDTKYGHFLGLGTELAEYSFHQVS